MDELPLWPDYQRFPKLYSSDPQIRYDASKTYGEELPAQEFQWPPGCWGAANAWLALVGPSRGKPPPGKPAGTLQPEHPKIGEKALSIQFAEGKGRNPRFAAICRAGFGSNIGEDIPRKLSALLNLCPDNEADSRKLQEVLLQKGCEPVWKSLREAKPRVIIALSRKVWDYLPPFLEQHGFKDERISAPPPFKHGRPLDCKVLPLFPETKRHTLLLRSPQHPSMSWFKLGTHDFAIRDTVDWFLQSQL